MNDFFKGVTFTLGLIFTCWILLLSLSPTLEKKVSNEDITDDFFCEDENISDY